MRLSVEAVQEFQAICREEFGIELSQADAEQRAHEVLDLVLFLFEEDVSGRAPDSDFDSLEPIPVP